MGYRKNVDLGVTWLYDDELMLGRLDKHLRSAAMGLAEWNNDYADFYFIFHESWLNEIKELSIEEIEELVGVIEHEYTSSKNQPKEFYFVRGTSPNRKGTVWQSNLSENKEELRAMFSNQLDEGSLELLTAIV